MSKIFRYIIFFSTLIITILVVRAIYADRNHIEHYEKETLPTSYSFIKLDDNYELVKDTLEFKFQYAQIEKFIYTPKIQLTIRAELHRNDNSFIQYYGHYLRSEEERARQVGYLAFGLYYSHIGKFDSSLIYIDKLDDSFNIINLKYWRARSLALRGDFISASSILNNCIQSNYKPDSCMKLLIRSSYITGNLKFSYEIMRKYPQVETYLYPQERATVLKHNLSSASFYILNLKEQAMKPSFYSALLIAMIWFMLITKLNIFDADIYIAAITVLILSILSTFCLTDYLYSFYEKLFFYNSKSNLFLHCLLVIGVVEELVKAIPFLITVIVLRIKNPVTLLIIAGISGLGFSFLENIVYLEKYGVDAISVRGFCPSMLHIITTSLLGYATVYYQFVNKKNLLLWLVLGFLAAIFIHGIYDYFIFLERDYKLYHISNISILIVTVIVSIYGMIVANTLCVSPDFSYNKSLKLNNLLFSFLSGLLAIELLEYVHIVSNMGVKSGDIWLALNVVKIVIAVSVISFLITNKDLVKNRWSIFNLYPFCNNTNLNQVLSRKGIIKMDGYEFDFFPEIRLADNQFKTNYIKIKDLSISALEGKISVVEFERLEDEIYNTGQIVKLGYLNSGGAFVKIKDVNVKLNG